MRKVILYFMIFPFFLSGQESKSSNKLDMTADFYLSIFDVVDKYEEHVNFLKQVDIMILRIYLKIQNH